MKKRTLGRMAVLAFALCMVTTCLLGGTLAKYTTAVTGTGTASVAAWSFKVNNQSTATITGIALTDTTLNSKVTSGKVAPGTDGQLQVSLDATGSDVAIDWTVEISNVANKPTNLKFYSDNTFNTPLTETSGKYTVSGTIALNAVGTAVTVPIYWKWAYETTSGDAADTGDQGKAMTFDIGITGTQQDPG